MVVIDDKKIDQISQLSQLELTKLEKVEIKSDMEDLITFFDKLKTMDVSGVEPLAHPFPLEMTMNEDIVKSSQLSMNKKEIYVTKVIL